MRAARVLALLAALAGLAGCMAVPPPPLERDPRWQEVLRSGHIPSRGSLYVAPPELAQPADLELAEGIPVEVREEGDAYWPQALPEGFLQELRTIVKKNSGYDAVLWDAADPAADPVPCDLELRLRVTRFRLELRDVGLASATAALWPFGPVYLASFYNAPDETYRCEYRLEATLQRGGVELARRTLEAHAELALTDFQRGWSLRSHWPRQTPNLLAGDDLLEAWAAYAPSIIASCEPHPRRELLIQLMAFLREDTPRTGLRRQGLVVGTPARRADAEAMAEWLGRRTPALIGAEASADAVQQRLWEMAGRAQPGDSLVIYAACGVSGTALRFADRPIGLDRLLEPLRAARRQGATALLVVAAGLPERATPPAARLDGVHLWLGPADFGETLRAGLGGAADADGDDGVTLAELEAYAEDQTSGASRLLGPSERESATGLEASPAAATLPPGAPSSE